MRSLRAAAGEPSYGELTRRVIEQRVARGIPVWEARVGRTTVYDVFRPGRRVIDPALVGDLVLALGGSAQDAAAWVERCEQARRPPREEIVAVPARFENGAGSPAAPAAPRAARPSFAPRARMLLLVACLALNLAGRVLVLGTHIPLYLDMVGTAVAAIIAGPWAGVLVGVATSVAGAAVDGWISVPFAPVETVGALMWAYGVRKLGLGRSVPRFFLLNVVVGLACTVVAVPIIVWLDHGVTGDGADAMTRSMLLVWHSLLPAVASQNAVTSIADKLISGFTALAVCEALPPGRDHARVRIRSAWLACAARRFRSPAVEPRPGVG